MTRSCWPGGLLQVSSESDSVPIPLSLPQFNKSHQSQNIFKDKSQRHLFLLVLCAWNEAEGKTLSGGKLQHVQVLDNQ